LHVERIERDPAWERDKIPNIQQFYTEKVIPHLMQT
jgi:hypothetical protein